MNDSNVTDKLNGRISVVIPTYNLAAYIGRAIHSVLAQTRPADEIIIVDDGSDDGTADIITSYGVAVRYIVQENAGASAARNAGITAARYEWIAFLDGDDEWLPEKLARQTALIARNPHLNWVTGNFFLCEGPIRQDREKLPVDEGKKLLAGQDYFGDYFAAYNAGATGWTGTMVIRKEALEQAGGFCVGQKAANDLDMWWRIAYDHPQIGYVPEPLAKYHSTIPDSITKKYRQPIILAELLERHLDLSAQKGQQEQFESCARRMVQNRIHEYLLDERIGEVPEFLSRFGHILPRKYQRRVRLLTLCPRVTSFLRPLLRWINRYLRIPV